MSQRTFDYVIVGGGSAGCLLANRLSENPNITVALIEQGPDDTSYLTQNAWATRLGISRYGKKFFFSNNHATKKYWWTGECLGGTSVINGMLYVRGNPDNY